MSQKTETEKNIYFFRYEIWTITRGVILLLLYLIQCCNSSQVYIRINYLLVSMLWKTAINWFTGYVKSMMHHIQGPVQSVNEIWGNVYLIYDSITRDLYSYWLFWSIARRWLDWLQWEYTVPNKAWTHAVMMTKSGTPVTRFVFSSPIVRTIRPKLD